VNATKVTSIIRRLWIRVDEQAARDHHRVAIGDHLIDIFARRRPDERFVLGVHHQHTLPMMAQDEIGPSPFFLGGVKPDGGLNFDVEGGVSGETFGSLGIHVVDRVKL
jgi:hypothetical protein